MAKILYGKPVCAAIKERCAQIVSERISKGGLAPKMAIVSVGDDSSNASFLRGIKGPTADTGVLIKQIELPEDTTQAELEKTITGLNKDKKIDGILLMRPLPKNSDIDEAKLCNMILPEKDIDAANSVNVTSAYLQNGGFSPCTPEAIMKVLAHYDVELDGKNVCVIGRSLVVGRPVAQLLTNKNATVTICHTHTKNMAEITKAADVVVVAAGAPRAFGSEYFREGQVVIDAGINWDANAGKICGDVNFDEVEPVVDAITPVPGGIGPITSCVLVEHTI